MTVDDFPRSVTVYGTGLMGSSLALALKKCVPGLHVSGVDKPEILSRAQRLGILDSTVDSTEPQPSELAILAAPVGAILELIDNFTPGAQIILDVGSTKVEICRRAESRGLAFIGGHPMTGSERSGPEAASAELFKGALFFLCPISTTPPHAVPLLTRIIEAIGGTAHVIAPEDHDRLVAQLSHLPQILSTLLADQTSEHTDFAGPGWNSVTRLAASPFHIWRDIFKTSGSLPGELRAFITRMQSVLDALEAGNLQEIEDMFERANRAVSEDFRE